MIMISSYCVLLTWLGVLAIIADRGEHMVPILNVYMGYREG